jgi:hypothetical protein
MHDLLDLRDLGDRAKKALTLALPSQPVTHESLRFLSQAAIRRLPGVGSNALSEIVRWAARHGVQLPRWCGRRSHAVLVLTTSLPDDAPNCDARAQRRQGGGQRPDFRQ